MFQEQIEKTIECVQNVLTLIEDEIDRIESDQEPTVDLDVIQDKVVELSLEITEIERNMGRLVSQQEEPKQPMKIVGAEVTYIMSNEE